MEPSIEKHNRDTTCLSAKWVDMIVIRPDDPDEYMKFAQTKEEYELDYYPTYCGGPCALMSADVMEKIFSFSRQTNPGTMSIEDALFTGVIRVKANLSEPAFVDGVCTHLTNDKVAKIRSWQTITTLF